MISDEQREKLKQHPDCITLEWMGEEVPWYLGDPSFQLARERGVTVTEILPGMQVGSTEDEAAAIGLEKQSKLFWAGRLVFDPDLKLEDVRLMMSYKQMGKIGEPMLSAMDADVDIPAAKKKDT